MNEYYKFIHQKFTHVLEIREEKQKQPPKNLSSLTKAEMDESVKRFLQEKVCPSLFQTDRLNAAWKEQAVISMTIFLFSHRHTKTDLFLVETRDLVDHMSERHDFMHMDFSVVRDVMYRYSKKAQERFFSFPIETYYFVKFAASTIGQDFIRSKPDGDDKPDKIKRLLSDTHELRVQAEQSML
jgi:hypothetical protein